MLNQRCSDLFRQFINTVNLGEIPVTEDKEFALFHLRDLIQQIAIRIGRPRHGITHCEEWALSYDDLCIEAFSTALAIWQLVEPEKSFYDFVCEIEDVNLPQEGKAGDYNSGGIEFIHYWPAGPSDVWIMVHGKSLRLTSLLLSGREPNFESIANNCLDCASYIIWLWVITTIWKEEYLS